MFTITDMNNVSVYRIKSRDTNKFALIGGSGKIDLPFVSCIEIFDIGGKTPPNMHKLGYEFFYVLHGQGMLIADNTQTTFSQGMSFTLQPNSLHEIYNLGIDKLYTLTFMVPDDHFLKLICSGIEDKFDETDFTILTPH